MIKEQSRFTINPLYVVAVTMCCIVQYIDTLQQGLLFALITVAIALITINLISMVEKIADKNLRVFLIAMLSAAIIIVLEYVFELIGWEILTANVGNIKWILLAVVSLSIVPTYFETRLTTKHYFVNMFFSVFSFLILTIIYSAIIEILGDGTIFGVKLFNGFAGFVFAKELFFKMFLVAILIIVSNLVYQKSEDDRMRKDLLVEKYKILIKQILTKRDQKEGK